MTDVKRKYFKIEAEEAKKTLDAYNEYEKPIQEARESLLKDVGADEFVLISNNLYAFAFEATDINESEKRTGLRYDRTILSGGIKYHTYRPDKRSIYGRSLAIKLADKSLKLLSFSAYAVEMHKAYSDVFSARAFHYSTAGFKHGMLLFIVPYDDGDGARPCPAPVGATEIPKSEFIRITEES